MLLDKIKDDLKEAMKAKDEKKVGTLRMLISAIRNKEITLRDGAAVEMTDEVVLEVVAAENKKRKDSIEAYTSGGRADLAEIEKAELGILESYLPAQLNDEELEKIVKDVITELGANACVMGKVIGAVMPRVKGQADGGRVSAIVKKLLQ